MEGDGGMKGWGFAHRLHIAHFLYYFIGSILGAMGIRPHRCQVDFRDESTSLAWYACMEFVFVFMPSYVCVDLAQCELVFGWQHVCVS